MLHRFSLSLPLLCAAFVAAVSGPLARERAVAQPAAGRSQISAATDDAVARLREQIFRESVTRGVTVGEFVARTGSAEQLNRALRRADMIGGPRWVDQETCQVQLEISGVRLARVLQGIADDHPDGLPAPRAALRDLEDAWQRRTFSATGSSVSAAGLSRLRPRDLPASWAGVPEPDREKAVAAARQDAITRVLQSVSDVPLGPPQTVGDALKDPRLRGSVEGWLKERPLTRLRYRDDLQVEVTLGVTAGEVFEFVAATLQGNTAFPPPASAAALQAMRQAFAAKVTTFGRSGPAGPLPPRAQRPAVPAAPAWVADRVEVDGSVTPAGRGPRLLDARADAAGLARGALRTRVEALAYQDTTLGAAARRDPRLRRAMDRVLSLARVERTEYLPNGTVLVRLSLDLRDVWEEVRDPR